MNMLNSVISLNLIDGKNLIVFSPLKAPIRIIDTNNIIAETPILSLLSKENIEKLVLPDNP